MYFIFWKRGGERIFKNVLNKWYVFVEKYFLKVILRIIVRNVFFFFVIYYFIFIVNFLKVKSYVFWKLFVFDGLFLEDGYIVLELFFIVMFVNNLESFEFC